ncbi:MAG: hypothetical protein ACFFDX_16265 [Candidatus Odinarchaeota archaeon]
MLLYNVAENGTLRKTTVVNFDDSSRVYLIDEEKIIYLWQGNKASKKKKDLSLKRAQLLNKSRDDTAKIQIIQQNSEFGGFLAIMDALKEGQIKTGTVKKRPELELEIDDTQELIEAGLEPDLIAEINLAAYELAQKNKDYKSLCRDLAKLQLSIIKGRAKPSESEIKNKTEEIFRSSSTYEEVCWLISELKILSSKNYFKKKFN